MKYTTVLFDADDTLFDFSAAEREAIRSVLKKYDLPSDDDIVVKYSKINLSFWKMLERGEIKRNELKIRRFEAFCEELGFDVDAVDMASSYMNELSKQSQIKNGAEKVCKNLYGKCRLYIITNGIKFIQEGRFSSSPLMKYFENIFISETIGYDKPSIEYFEAVAASIPDFDKKRTLVVGDSLTSDIQGGINFGIDTCWYNPKRKDRPDGMDITYEIETLDRIYDVVTSE